MPRNKNGNDDAFVEVSFETKFTSNEKYHFWTFLFTLILMVLGFLFLITVMFYFYQTSIYHKYSTERKGLKKELMKIKDTEYQNFLLGELENQKMR